MFLIYLFVATACIVCGMAFNGTMPYFLDAPSLCIVLIPSTTLTVASYGWGNVRRAFSISDHVENPDTLHKTAASFGMNCVWFGILSMLIGAVKILALWNEIDSADQIAPAASVMLLPLTYGLCFHALFAKPFADRWQKAIHSAE